jgi:FAD dependent oxidoreductase.
MTKPKQHLSIIGAGIVGLMIAYKSIRQNPTRDVTVFDEGPDPRAQERSHHHFGATYSGMDARHISVTETGPWTWEHRHDRIIQPATDAGWNCLSGESLTSNEQSWLEEFQRLARSRDLHNANYEAVMDINKAGLQEWAELAAELPDVFRPTDDSGYLPIVCTNPDDLNGERQDESELDRTNVSQATTALQEGIEALERRLKDGTIYGSFLVAGTAYNVCTLCTKLIGWLEQHDVCFHWETRVDIADDHHLPVPDGYVIFAAGVSTSSTKLLARQGVLLQGVVGCWVSIPNPGYRRPFKVLGIEPVNFINATPYDNSLLLSGGYGWVGERTYSEALTLGQPIADAFAREVTKYFLEAGRSLDGVETALCIRPALPSGVPEIRELQVSGGRHRAFLCVGHAAGGFTQSPEVAQRVLELL